MKIKNLCDRLIRAAIIIYAAFFCYVSFLKYQNFIYNDFDLAIDAQTVWNMLHGSLYSSIHQIVFLGNHMRLILFLIAPFYAIFKTPLLLLFLQSVLLGLAAWPLYRIAKDNLGHSLAFAVAVSYLVYPALGYMNLFEFHPTALATCFLMFMLYYFYKNKFSAFILSGLLALICQENIALLLLTTGIFAFFMKKEKKWFVLPALIGIFYFYIAVFKIMPLFNKGTIEFSSLYGHLGKDLPGILFVMLSPENMFFMFQLFAPVMFLSLFYLPLLAVALPVFMQHMLSSRIMEHTIFYHYSAELIPFIFVSAVFGIKRLLFVLNKPIEHRALLWLVIIVAVVSSVCLGPLGGISDGIEAWKSRKEISLQIDRLISLIPPDASVAATFEFLPKLSNRKYLYSFHHFYGGKGTLSEKEYSLPETIDFALINYGDRHTFEDFRGPDSDRNMKYFFERYGLKKIGGFDKVEFYKRSIYGEK